MTDNTTEKASETAGTQTSVGGKYLTFSLEGEEYGLEILKVQEIMKMVDVTKMPRAPEFIRGVINLRGKVIPVVDLRLKFEMEKLENTNKTCIIVMQVVSGDSAVTMGIIVDEVSEVLDIVANEIEPAPTLGTQVDISFIQGIAKTKGSVKILLNIDKALSDKDISAVRSVA